MVDDNETKREAVAKASEYADTALGLLTRATVQIRRAVPIGHDVIDAVHDAQRAVAIAAKKLDLVLKRMP